MYSDGDADLSSGCEDHNHTLRHREPHPARVAASHGPQRLRQGRHRRCRQAHALAGADRLARQPARLQLADAAFPARCRHTAGARGHGGLAAAPAGRLRVRGPAARWRVGAGAGRRGRGGPQAAAAARAVACPRVPDGARRVLEVQLPDSCLRQRVLHPRSAERPGCTGRPGRGVLVGRSSPRPAHGPVPVRPERQPAPPVRLPIAVR